MRLLVALALLGTGEYAYGKRIAVVSSVKQGSAFHCLVDFLFVVTCWQDRTLVKRLFQLLYYFCVHANVISVITCSVCNAFYVGNDE